MNCADWSEHIAAYVDGELDASRRTAFLAHVQDCSRCGAQALALTESKTAVRSAGSRYTPPAGLRERVLATAIKEVGGRAGRDEAAIVRPRRSWTASMSRPVWAFALAALLLCVLGLGLFLANRNSQAKALAQLADLHVMALASPNPVDVVSTDRHTVKPWFQGKLPFSFDLPELAGTPFSLVGGRVAYFHQEPGAQLIFAYQRHLISVFVFRDTSQLGLPGLVSDDRSSSFTTSTWTRGGLRYVIVGDAGPSTIRQLAEILQPAQ